MSEETSAPVLTTRLAFGLVALSGLGSMFLLQEAQTYRSGLEGQLRDLEVEIQSLSGADTADMWTKRRDEAVKAKEAWTARHWTGETAGIASAAAQSELMDLAQNAKMESIKADVASDPLLVSGQELIRFELIGMGDTEAFVRLLLSLSSHPRIIVVTEIDAPFRDAQKSRMSIAGYLAYLPPETPAQDTPD